MVKNSKKFEIEYKTLNKAQRQAVDAIEGPVLVVAGPGSGKTKVLTVRTANILKNADVRPSNILCLTFTENAAMNMKRRLADMIGAEAYGVAVHTFHSFGVDVIEKYPEFFYGGASFYPADDLVGLEIIEEILEDLRHDDPLAGTHPKLGYVSLKPVQGAIQKLKKAGLSAEEFEKIVDHNAKVLEELDAKISEVFTERMSKKSIEKVRALCEEIAKEREMEDPFPVAYFESLSESILVGLQKALSEAEDLEKATPLSGWKKQHTKKNAQKKLVLKETAELPKMVSLAGVYRAYRQKMYDLGYYDFEDMLLEVIQAVKKKPELQHELWEQYQYVMVDEFQDTNDAQMRLIYLLTESEVSEGRPNICAVGDDDQAIYKFQGALLSNILDFRKHYQDPQFVVLTENYRSTQDILDLAQFFIRKGEERLEMVVPEIEKKLDAKNTDLGKGEIISRAFGTDLGEYSWVSGEIRRLIDLGEDPKNIAVISRKHKALEEFSKYLSASAVPTFYERNQNVFDQEHVRQLVEMARFTTSLLKKDRDEADTLLPEILSYPFWRISRQTLWDIATKAERGKYHRQKWMDVMLSHEDENVKNIAEFFLEAARFSHSHTLLETLDFLIGEHMTFRQGSDEEAPKKKQVKKSKTLVSPFKGYYFNAKRFEETRVEYLTFLSALQVFVSAVREYRHGKKLSLEDLVTFVDRHEGFGIRIVDRSPFVGSADAVTLLSAHKAKGLEFSTVFVLSCQEDIWAGRGAAKKIRFPENLPLEPAGETMDDHLRLFFVALTRAKERLYMTSYERRSDGKLSPRLHFFDMPEEEEGDTTNEVSEKIRTFLEPEKSDHDSVCTHSDEIRGSEEARRESYGEYGECRCDEDDKEVRRKRTHETSPQKALYDSWKASHTGYFVPDEEAMLKKLLESYQMSATHLNNFLNVSEGGPKYFLEQSLLHFPQAKNPNMSYGTAMHKAIEELYTHLRMEGTLPEKEKFFAYFENALLKERLTDKENEKWSLRGRDALSGYYEKNKDIFDPKHRIETNFRKEGVVIGGAHLSGKVDKMIFAGDQAIVVDYKTGKSSADWKGKSDIDKQKLYRYKNQLLFYKLLVERSERFGKKYTVGEGRLEYLEPKKEDGSFVELKTTLTDPDGAELVALIDIVYAKIQDLDFPDTSKYSKDMKGMLQFVEDLKKGEI